MSALAVGGPVLAVDGLLAPRYAQRLLEHWEGFRGYALSGDGGTPLGRPVACAVAHRPTGVANIEPSGPPAELSAGLGQRADAMANFVRTGGRSGDLDAAPAELRARTNYFRATYASGPRIWEPVVCRLLNHPVLADAARQVYAGHPVVIPTEVYANVMLPGQELGVHTDVPAFRGAARGAYPLWFLVVMHHSGRFERWRIKTATAVLHLGSARHPGGEFAYYPDGPHGAAVSRPAGHNCATVLDTDSILHGVDRVGGADASRDLTPGTRLQCTDGRWHLHDGSQVRGGWSSEELRYSVSWKAHCFRSEDDRRTALEHTDDLTYDLIMARLLAGLPDKVGRLPTPALGRRLMDRYLRFPDA